MEEIYTLLGERLTSLNDLIIRLNQYDLCSSSFNITQPINNNDLQDILTHINQLKKLEKLRIMKENEYIDVIFSLRNFDLQQRQRFQIKSMDIMKNINIDFSYEKLQITGDIKDISKQYLKFFIYIKLYSKAEDLKRVYASNKFISYPIISILMKWLVEITRKQFQETLKTKISEICTMINKIPEFNTKFTHCGSYLLSEEAKNESFISQKPFQKRGQGSKAESSPIPMIKEEKTRLNCDNLISYMLRPGLKHFKEDKDPFLISKDLPFLSSPANNSSSPYDTTSNITFLSNTIGSKNDRLGKYRISNSQQTRGQSNIAQIFVPNNPNINHIFDPMEDLDLMHITSVYQIMNFYKQVKKNQTGVIMILDIEKKKEMVITIFRNLYQRNVDIEKNINLYKTKCYEKSKSNQKNITTKKGDAYIEKYNIDFFKRFPHMAMHPTSHNNSNNTSYDKVEYHHKDIEYNTNTQPKKSNKTTTSTPVNNDMNTIRAINYPININDSLNNNKDSSIKLDHYTSNGSTSQNYNDSIFKFHRIHDHHHLPDLVDTQTDILSKRPNSNPSSPDHLISPILNKYHFRIIKRTSPKTQDQTHEDNKSPVDNTSISKQIPCLNENQDFSPIMQLHDNPIGNKLDKTELCLKPINEVSDTILKDMRHITITPEFKGRSISASAYQKNSKKLSRISDSYSIDDKKTLFSGKASRPINTTNNSILQNHGMSTKHSDEKRYKIFENCLSLKESSVFYPGFSPKTNLAPLGYKAMLKDINIDYIMDPQQLKEKEKERDKSRGRDVDKERELDRDKDKDKDKDKDLNQIKELSLILSKPPYSINIESVLSEKKPDKGKYRIKPDIAQCYNKSKAF